MSSPDSTHVRLRRDGSDAPPATGRPHLRRAASWLSLGIGAFGGMMLAALEVRSQFPWSYPEWTFWSVFGELASMPLTGYGGVGMVLGLPLLATAFGCVCFSRRRTSVVAAVAGPIIAAAMGFLWMHLGDLVASLGV